jgi:hypothetical protein
MFKRLTDAQTEIIVTFLRTIVTSLVANITYLIGVTKVGDEIINCSVIVTLLVLRTVVMSLV